MFQKFLDKLDGYKTKLGTSMVAVGVFLETVGAFVPDLGPNIVTVGKALEGLGAALVAWGIGHKIDKNTKAITE